MDQIRVAEKRQAARHCVEDFRVGDRRLARVQDALLFGGIPLRVRPAGRRSRCLLQPAGFHGGLLVVRLQGVAKSLVELRHVGQQQSGAEGQFQLRRRFLLDLLPFLCDGEEVVGERLVGARRCVQVRPRLHVQQEGAVGASGREVVLLSQAKAGQESHQAADFLSRNLVCQPVVLPVRALGQVPAPAVVAWALVQLVAPPLACLLRPLLASVVQQRLLVPVVFLILLHRRCERRQARPEELLDLLRWRSHAETCQR